MLSVNVPRQLSKVGAVDGAGADGFEGIGMRKTGSVDMPVARDEDEGVLISTANPILWR